MDFICSYPGTGKPYDFRFKINRAVASSNGGAGGMDVVNSLLVYNIEADSKEI